MAKPNNAKPGCFSDFFQLLFCAEDGNSSPMHPSNHITKPYATEVVHSHKDAMAKNATKPGVVARLMGLDSLPSTKLVSNTNNTPDSIPRSRSVNFVDYLRKFDTTSQANHHQVKTTSASFREVPSLLQHKNKNNDLVVFYWNNESEDQEVVSFLRKQEMGLGESRQRKKQGSKNKEIVSVTKERSHTKRKKISKFENEPRVVLPLKHSSKVRNHHETKVLAPVSACSKSCSNSRRKCGSGPSGLRPSSNLPNKQKKVFSEPKCTKKTKKQQSTKKIDTECSTENFSPISVLDDYDYSFLYGPDFPDYTNPVMPKIKWESSEQLFTSDNVGDRASKNKGYSYPDINKKEEYLSELMVKLRNLTQNEMRESDFTPKRMCESGSYEEICMEYEHKIFDILLNEVVNELVELSY
ncbi:hypothetical protein JHK82_051101 [Glycine max]|uniref:DUF3741 domain-containing protein n=1 Tax=Glycine soja TaxID=3848 RepID=A0A0B2QFL8_GLYSO|nr:uncharacterized protein LOC114396088 [Glycine soja]KAG4925266.1 hypothetical protein JHK87_050806 [Glycine soja]KAG5092323.1 hypothetical protein JHK82_051101 [Glycine max]KHN20306.1 hypothetical protein glysoja_034689 [Glycine soja]RZB52874.1 hypothetical protein D0Y65_049078 [Glycine soja]